MLNHDDEEKWKNVGDEEIVSTFLFAHSLKILQKYYISRCKKKIIYLDVFQSLK